MHRVLALLPTQADFQTRRSVATLEGGLGPEFALKTRMLGSGGDWATRAGAVLGLWRLTQVDAVHAWGRDALTAAALGGRARLIYSPLPEEPPATRWIRSISAHRSIDVLCASSSQARNLVEHGVAPQRCHLIRPGVDMGRASKRRSSELRSALGLAGDDRVVLAAGESTDNAAHHDAVWTMSLLHELDPRWRLLVCGQGDAMPSLRTSAARFGKDESLMVVAADRLQGAIETEDLYAVADAILVTAAGPVATLPIAMAMASGSPIVGTATHTVAELLEDRHTALLVRPHSPRLAAQRVLELFEDSSLRWKLTDRARVEAYEYFSQTRFIDQFRSAYRQAASDRPLTIPQPRPGAGLRFGSLA